MNRKSDMINVGGNKVNPLEIEDYLNAISGVLAARVYGKPNSVVGNIVCAEIVRSNPQIDETSLRKELSGILQDFKIPRMFIFKESLTLTRTGKISR